MMEAHNTAACGSIKGLATSRQLAMRSVSSGHPDAHTLPPSVLDTYRENGTRYASEFSGYHVSGAIASRWRHRPGRAVPR